MAQETEKSFPFDAEETATGYDREYMADDYARYFRAFISSGIFMKESTNLQVIANGDMTVTLSAGKMIIDGYRYENTGEIIIAIDPADGVLGRIDRISVTWSKEDRDIHYTLQKGTPSYEPVAPELRRTEEYKDYVVADILVAAGVISIKQQDITDQRLNTQVCGLAVPFSEVDTTTIFNQYQEALTEFLQFADSCIDETVAGQLKADIEKKLDKTGDSGENVVAFTQTSNRQNIMTGDTHKTMFGKIKKWLADLTATAFAQMITSSEDLLATKVTGYVPDAKAVADVASELNRKLTASDNTPFRFGVNEDGEYGYIVTDSAGADTVIPFKKYGTPTVLYSYGVSNSGAGSVSTTKTMPRDGLCIVFAHTCGSNYFLNPTVKLNNVAQKILTSYKADDNTKGGNAACFEVKKGDSVYVLAPKDSGSSGQAGIIMLII